MVPAKIVGFIPGLLKLDVEKGCGKKSYSTVQDAYRVIKKSKKKKNRRECRIYKCTLCHKFHLTSSIDNK